MRVATYVELVWDGEKYVTGYSEGYEYQGPVTECKGGDVANEQRKQELALQQQAFALQQQAFNQQQKQLDFLNTQFSQYLTNPQGFTPEQMAMMQSQFLNNNSNQFQQAGQGLRSSLAARGGGLGDAPISGDYVRGLEGLMGAGAASQSQGLLNLGLANAQQALANKFNAGSILSGNAATLTGAQGASSNSFGSAGSAASSALNSYIQAQNSGFLSSFGKALGSGLGGGLSSAFTGGLGTLMSNVGSGNYGW